MYEAYYGFKEKPFTTLPDPDFLYLSSKHELAFTYLEYGLSSQAGFIVLTGEIGSGKTTLLNYLIEKLDTRTTSVAFIFNTNVNPYDFLVAVAHEWGIEGLPTEKAMLYDTLTSFLLAQYAKKIRPILIIDEAQNLPFETLEEVRMLSNLNDGKKPLLHIIFSGQPNLIHRLNNPRLEQLRQRVVVHYHIEPLDLQETQQYIEHRLKKAAAKDLGIFTQDAIARIYEYSGGIPRIINLLCDLALVYGYAEQTRPLGAPIIDMVVQDRKRMGLGFGTVSSSPVPSPQAYVDIDEEKVAGLSKKYRELCDNVYELARLVKKMIDVRDDVSRQQQELQQLYRKIRKLEARCLAACAGNADRSHTYDQPVPDRNNFTPDDQTISDNVLKGF